MRWKPEGHLFQLVMCFAVFLVWSVAASAEKVVLDPVWPSVGPGSSGPRPEPEIVELEVPLPDASLTEPRSSVEETGFNSPPVALGFAGVNGTGKDGFLHKPPDTHIAVGTGSGSGGRVIMITNSDLEIFNKNGTSLATSGGLDAFLGTTVPDAFDPKVLYDQHSGRFFTVVLEDRTPNTGGTGGRSNVHIAVSTDSTPSNTTADWVKMSGSALTNFTGDGAGAGPGGVYETWFDYPSIGADSDSLFVTGNMFDSGGIARGVKIRVFSKAALLSGSYTFVDINVDAFATPGAFTVQPAHVYGTTDSGDFYLVNRVNPSLYRLWQITGDPGSPSIVTNAQRSWTAGNFVSAGAPQSGTTVSIDTLSPRAMNAVYRDGHVWCCLSSDMDGDAQTEVYWVQIATSGGSPSVPGIADSGFINSSTADAWTFMPSINVNASGDAAICYTQSGPVQFPDMRFVSRHVTDPAGTFQSPTVAASSPGFYWAFGTTGGEKERWGDYSGCVVDPDDDETFWVANETVRTSAPSSSIWDTFIARVSQFTRVRDWTLF